MIDRIQPVCIPESTAPFSQVVLDDLYAYFSGLVAADFPEGLAVLGDVAAETTAVLNVISKVLEELGLEMSDIVKVEVHLADLTDFDAIRGGEPMGIVIDDSNSRWDPFHYH